MERGKGRLSNIELLRILAIVIIVMMHGAGCLLGTTYLPNRIGLTAVNSVAVWYTPLRAHETAQERVCRLR
ncbi:MAG: hypothetical protein K2G76_02560, partial [Prevotella sp.]|nr:hypothetical protein [Prevotella sp.]